MILVSFIYKTQESLSTSGTSNTINNRPIKKAGGAEAPPWLISRLRLSQASHASKPNQSSFPSSHGGSCDEKGSDSCQCT